MPTSRLRIDELSVAVECKLKDYNPETCILRGEIVNVSVDERVLDQNGKVDASKVIPVIFDPFNNDYLKVGEKVILFNLSGHGLIDMASYDQYLAGNLMNYELKDEDIQKNLDEIKDM